MGARRDARVHRQPEAGGPRQGIGVRPAVRREDQGRRLSAETFDFSFFSVIIPPSFLVPAGENFCPPKLTFFPFLLTTAGLKPPPRELRVHGKRQVNTILLIRWGGLGDLLVTLPAMRLLRHGFPTAKITLVARREYGGLLLQADVVDEVVGLDDPRTPALVSGAGAGGRDRSAWLSGFDLVLSWLNRSTSASPESGLTICYGPGGRESISQVFYRRTLEAVGRDLLRRMDFDECARLPLSAIPDGPGFPFQDRPVGSRPLAVIHPGSGGEKKRWPLDGFLEVAGRLRNKNVEGVFVTGEAEQALDRRIEAAARRLGWTWLRSPSLARAGAAPGEGGPLSRQRLGNYPSGRRLRRPGAGPIPERSRRRLAALRRLARAERRGYRSDRARIRLERGCPIAVQIARTRNLTAS